MRDPYKVLGLDQNTPYDELQSKYKELRSIYSEQRFKAGEEGNEGARKLHELEEAWLEIEINHESAKIAKGANANSAVNNNASASVDNNANGANGTNASGAEAFGAYTAARSFMDEEDNQGYAQIDRLIRDGKYGDAQTALDNIKDRGGQWHYYQSMLFYKREWLTDARTQMRMAVDCEPNNQKYRTALDGLNRKINGASSAETSSAYGTNTPPTQTTKPPADAGDCLSTCCCAYCLTDLCCNMASCC